MIEQLKAQLAQVDTSLLTSKLEGVERLAHNPGTKHEKAQAADPEIRAQMCLMADMIREELAKR